MAKVNSDVKPCDVCKTKGYLEDKDKHGKIIKTICLICQGAGYLEKENEKI